MTRAFLALAGIEGAGLSRIVFGLANGMGKFDFLFLLMIFAPIFLLPRSGGSSGFGGYGCGTCGSSCGSSCGGGGCGGCGGS